MGRVLNQTGSHRLWSDLRKSPRTLPTRVCLADTTCKYVEHMIKHASNGTFKGKRVALSGSGNVAQYAGLKAIELGAIVVSLSDSRGTIIKEDGITPEEIYYIADLKVKRKSLTEMKETKYKDNIKYIDGVRPWEHCGKVDVALPCATQNEVSGKEAETLIKSGARFIAEGSNMGCSPDAIDVFEKDRQVKKRDAIWYAPGMSYYLLLSSPSIYHYPLLQYGI